MTSPLPPLPEHGLAFRERGRVQSSAKYLHLASFEVTHGERTAAYDVVERNALDAVVVVPYWREGDDVMVRLRTVVRPPLAVRPATPPGVPSPPATLWEVPAGLVEPGEGPAEAAARELFEELAVRPEQLEPLGPPVCPCPAVLGELHIFFAARLARPTGAFPAPEGDGSLYEENAAFVSLSLQGALDACRRGEVWDSKTELGLRRLADRLGAR